MECLSRSLKVSTRDQISHFNKRPTSLLLPRNDRIFPRSCCTNEGTNASSKRSTPINAQFSFVRRSDRFPERYRFPRSTRVEFKESPYRLTFSDVVCLRKCDYNDQDHRIEIVSFSNDEQRMARRGTSSRRHPYIDVLVTAAKKVTTLRERGRGCGERLLILMIRATPTWEEAE